MSELRRLKQKLGHTEQELKSLMDLKLELIEEIALRERDLIFGFEPVNEIAQDGARVVFQGVEGAYSFAAMNTYFHDREFESFHVDTWREAMEAISYGKADYAVLPIENSTAGSVVDIYDLLVEYPHSIVGEQIIPVRHVLMGCPECTLDTITDVYSHPQGLAQCTQYLDARSGWSRHKVLNTAVAAKLVAEHNDPTKAAIASRYAADYFGLKIVDENIFNSANNETRFVIISDKKMYTRTAKKMSIAFTLSHSSGTLYTALAHFMFNQINLTNIESRPIEGKNWEYRFFIDFEGNLADAGVQNALNGLMRDASEVRIFGNYE